MKKITLLLTGLSIFALDAGAIASQVCPSRPQLQATNDCTKQCLANYNNTIKTLCAPGNESPEVVLSKEAAAYETRGRCLDDCTGIASDAAPERPVLQAADSCHEACLNTYTTEVARCPRSNSNPSMPLASCEGPLYQARVSCLTICDNIPH